MTGPDDADVVIVGAGHAGVHLAVALARSDPGRSVTVLGDEAVLPYERPPLTKRMLYGGPAEAPALLRSPDYWVRSPVALRTGERVVSVDPDGRTVRTAAGDVVGYRSLVWAAGGHAVSCGLPGEDLRGVHSVRDLADLAALRGDLTGARTAVVVGGGYVGLEAAAGLTALGLAVTVVETAPRLLARVAGPVVSDFLAGLHAGRGVDVRLRSGARRIVGRDGRVAGVVLTDESQVAADVVVVGVGMRPAVAPLVAAGARGDAAGVEVDSACRTSLPGVLAIGDCARQVNPWSASGGSMRVESVHNAGLHAAAAARAIEGLPAIAPMPPRFWSTQYGCELRTVGLPHAEDEQVVRGDPSLGGFSVAYLRDGRLAAIDTIDRPRDFARAQGLVAAHWTPEDRELLADPAQDLPRAGSAAAPAPG